MYIEIDENTKVLGYSDKPSGSSIETNEQLPTYTDVQVLKFVGGKFVVEESKELADAKAEYEANQYQRDRQYPPIGDQLDQIFWEGIDEWKKVIKAVKDAHPKPE
tara:strand:+ start:1417 stop:1731 length:315 start_codon:yes stop_codon:yes gene_type:complete